MDWHDIESLHRQASDHYARREFKEALEAWSHLLELDPADTRALEGVRMSRLLGEEGVETAQPTQGHDLRRRLDEVEARLEAGDFHGAMRSAELLRAERADEPEVLATLARAYLAAGTADQAAEICGQLLALDPSYYEAAHLLRQCQEMAPGRADLDVDLLVEKSASLPKETPKYSLGAGLLPEPDASWQSHGMDAGDIAALEPVPLGRGSGVDVVPSVSSEDAGGAAAVLKRRVAELMRQAREAQDEGHSEQALGFVSRLLILDEENDEARALEDRIRGALGEGARDVDALLNEGVQWLEQGRLEEARGRFLEVLDRVPDHAEALDYLDKTDAKLAAQEADTQAPHSRAGPIGSAEQRVAPPAASSPAPLDGRAQAAPLSSAPRDIKLDREPTEHEAEAEHGAETPETPAKQGKRQRIARFTRSRRPLMISAAALLLLLATGWLASGRFRESQPEGSPALEAPPTDGPAQKPHESQSGTPVGAAPAPQPQQAGSFSQALAKAKAAFDRGDYEAAVIHYDDALVLDPDNAIARAGLVEAGENYRKRDPEAEQLTKARHAFAAGEYESALRLLYRLPAGLVDPAVLDRYKANGWYNLGVIALRGAECTQAAKHFGEALTLRPADRGVEQVKALAERYLGARKNRDYYDTVESLPFRDLED